MILFAYFIIPSLCNKISKHGSVSHLFAMEEQTTCILFLYPIWLTSKRSDIDICYIHLVPSVPLSFFVPNLLKMACAGGLSLQIRGHLLSFQNFLVYSVLILMP